MGTAGESQENTPLGRALNRRRARSKETTSARPHAAYLCTTVNAVEGYATVDCLNTRGPGTQNAEDDVTSYPGA